MDYIKSPSYYNVFAYTVNAERVKIYTTCHLAEALRKARQYENWQIEETKFYTNLPF